MSSDSAFYQLIDAGRYRATAATAGPWSSDLQHGGPPSALLASAMEQHAEPSTRLARVTVEIIRPVPVADLQVEVEVVRAGRRSTLLAARLSDATRTVAVASGWLLAPSPADTPPLRPAPGPDDLPAAARPTPAMTGAHTFGYVDAMEWRFTRGTDFDDLGPGQCWVRQRLPLVEGVPDTGVTRAMVAADSSWAVGFEIDRASFSAINVDLTVSLHRAPVGEWLCLTTDTAASAGGSAVASGRLDDRDGDCGRIIQNLLVGELPQ